MTTPKYRLNAGQRAVKEQADRFFAILKIHEKDIPPSVRQALFDAFTLHTLAIRAYCEAILNSEINRQVDAAE